MSQTRTTSGAVLGALGWTHPVKRRAAV